MRLHLALEPFLLGQAGHHQQRIAEDQPVRPVLLVLVEVDLLVEVDRAAVEVGEEVELVVAGLLDAGQVLDDGLRMNLLLDVDRHDGDGEVFAVLLVLALPDELRVERRDRAGRASSSGRAHPRPRSRAAPRWGCWRACPCGGWIRPVGSAVGGLL